MYPELDSINIQLTRKLCFYKERAEFRLVSASRLRNVCCLNLAFLARSSSEKKSLVTFKQEPFNGLRSITWTKEHVVLTTTLKPTGDKILVNSFIMANCELLDDVLENEEILSKVEIFLENGCGCSYGARGGQCSQQFSKEAVLFNVNNCLERD